MALTLPETKQRAEPVGRKVWPHTLPWSPSERALAGALGCPGPRGCVQGSGRWGGSGWPRGARGPESCPRAAVRFLRGLGGGLFLHSRRAVVSVSRGPGEAGTADPGLSVEISLALSHREGAAGGSSPPGLQGCRLPAPGSVNSPGVRKAVSLCQRSHRETGLECRRQTPPTRPDGEVDFPRC